ncbi:MAG: cation:dicarboxylase symporter family transporter [Faecalibacterium prausnitzii]|jgi:proton/glutamate symporter|uniref:Dicarboxylate/amino acid:cation symporter n=1 Tax=Faecalibacterium butyricigenerans TaxID=1851427 RepID=A0ABS8F9Z6_9FIRM|nr:cation:dicarboxylase symporter family transporter [Faecalibacterium sp. CLA-AA-H233]MBS7104904.1 cation:dicarboxylase symporter family transporter [Faecalibacterium prausnitzii]MCC2199763.1 dicarboxylate/amino acid:cation symporter [Faecalibacterium sp. CLA-AA-H233]
MIVAVTTTSSAATLPIKVAGEKLGVPENIYGFTLPLGNTCAHRSSTGQGGYECL